VRTWLDGFSSPLIQDEGENKLLKLRFDVSQYQPEEIVVKTVDNKLLVSGWRNARSIPQTEVLRCTLNEGLRGARDIAVLTRSHPIPQMVIFYRVTVTDLKIF
jgi:hypothetical protein